MMQKLKTTLICSAISASPVAAQSQLQNFENEARNIISQMTVEEKISQLMNETPGIPRLGIPPYDYWNEGLHGVARSGKATVFPEPIGIGATFDPALAKKIGDVIATEGRAKYIIARKNNNYARFTGLTFWSPNVNIFRDPRWGRGMETYGEDPFLTGTMGTAFVQGMQGNNPIYLKAAACGKHFAVHSGPEATRHKANIEPTKRDLWETYLPAFRMLVQKGHVESIMGAYNALYGASCSGSKYLLTDILRRQWGFKGHIVSDDGAVTDIFKGHHLAKSEAEGDAIALKAGLNLECGHSFQALNEAIRKKLISEKDLDAALKPLMMTRLKLGILKYDSKCPYNNVSEDEICSDAHTKLAKQAALESMVLLQNNGALPLRKDIHTLYVTGPGAADTFWQMGNYYGIANRYCSYLQGIASKVSAGTALNYRPGTLEASPTRNSINYALYEATTADVTIIFMGNNGNLEGEEGEAIDSDTKGDRTTLSLPESQMKYLRDIREKKKSGVIVVLTGGSPIDMREISKLADAVVMAWYPGQEGGYALADLIFGDANFSGRLPVTFPENVNKLPDFSDYTMNGRTYKYMPDNIYYPFGYGLSYGNIEYSDASVSIKDDNIKVTVKLTNKSKWNISEVVQIYASAPGAGISAPLEQLIGFQRVDTAPNSNKLITFNIDKEFLKTVQKDGTSRLLKGNYTISIGGAAPSKRTKELNISIAAIDKTF